MGSRFARPTYSPLPSSPPPIPNTLLKLSNSVLQMLPDNLNARQSYIQDQLIKKFVFFHSTGSCLTHTGSFTVSRLPVQGHLRHAFATQ